MPVDLRLTVEDYRLMPETGPRYQLIEGDLHMSPAPDRFHQDISRNLEFILLKYLEENPIGKLYHAPFDVCLSEHNVFQPDIAFFAKDRLIHLTKAGADGPPTLVVEVLSPKTASIDRDPKRRIYAATEVTELWIIDPKAKTLEQYELSVNADSPRQVLNARDTFKSGLFPGISISMADVFRQ